MWLDRRLTRATIFFTPYYVHFGADRNRRIDGCEAQSLFFVEAVARKHRQADHIAVCIGYAIVIGRRVIGERHIEEFILVAIGIK